MAGVRVANLEVKLFSVVLIYITIVNRYGLSSS